MFIMVDGIDGSGKSTALNVWKDHLKSQGNAIFDLKNYWQNANAYPDLSEIKSYDFIFSAEPTYTGIGAVIRQELIHTGNSYPAQAIAEAFSLDRLILYNKIIIPLLKEEKCVIQDRGVSSSLAYQSTQDNGLTMEKIAILPGNQLSIEHRPDWLIIVDTEPEICIQRLNARTDKHDNVIFEKLDFLKKLQAQFKNPDYQNIFTSRGGKIIYLNGNEKIDIMKQEAIKLLQQIIS